MNLAKNLLYLVSGETLSKILTVVTIAYVARVVGPAGFGYLEFAMSASLLVGVLVHQGLGLYGSREIARNPEQTETLVTEIASLRFALALIAYAGLAAFVYLIDRPVISEQLVLIYGLSLLFMPFGLEWVFQGHEKMQTSAALQVIRQGVFAIVVFAFVRNQFDLWPVAFAEVAGVIAVAVASFWLYRHQLHRRIKLPRSISIKVIREGAVLGLSGLFWSAKIFGATVVVGLIGSEQDVGYFGAAMRVLVGLHAFVWLYYINLLPTLSRGWAADHAIERQTAQSMRLVGWFGIGGGLIWVLLSPAAIRVLYGGDFIPAVPALQWLGVAFVVVFIHGHYRFGLIAANRQRDEMMTSAFGTIMSLSLIPVGYRTFGVTGAALALVAGELMILASSWLFSRWQLNLGKELLCLIRPLICIAVLCVVLSLIPAIFPVAVQIAIAVVWIGSAAYLSDGEMRRYARQLFAQRLRPRGNQRGDAP